MLEKFQIIRRALQSLEGLSNPHFHFAVIEVDKHHSSNLPEKANAYQPWSCSHHKDFSVNRTLTNLDPCLKERNSTFSPVGSLILIRCDGVTLNLLIRSSGTASSLSNPVSMRKVSLTPLVAYQRIKYQKWLAVLI